MNNLLAIPLFILVIIFWLEGNAPYFKDRKERLRHALPNMIIAFVDVLINLGFLFAITIPFIRWTTTNSFGILRLIHPPLWLELILAFILFDLWMYGWHRANHRLKLLWLLHRAHHNDIGMDSTTALRFHPLEIIISSIFNLAIIGFFGLDMRQLIFYATVFQPVIFFHHSNIALPEKWDRRLRAVIVTPNMHRVHHSIETGETNSNYSSVFSFWDRIFASFKKREDTRGIIYGLNIFRDNKWQGVRGFLEIPFQKIT